MIYYTYILRSINYPDHIYIGYTTDLKERLLQHNSGSTFYTAKYKPWNMVIFFGFKEKIAATKFEKYLKSHSGRAFISRHFLCDSSILNKSI